MRTANCSIKRYYTFKQDLLYGILCVGVCNMCTGGDRGQKRAPDPHQQDSQQL